MKDGQCHGTGVFAYADGDRHAPCAERAGEEAAARLLAPKWGVGAAASRVLPCRRSSRAPGRSSASCFAAVTSQPEKRG